MVCTECKVGCGMMMMMNLLPLVLEFCRRLGGREGGMGMSRGKLWLLWSGYGLEVSYGVLKCERKKGTSTPGVEPGSTRVKRLESE